MKTETLSKVYDWTVLVINKQGRLLSLDDMYKAMPFKREVTKEQYEALYNALSDLLK